MQTHSGKNRVRVFLGSSMCIFSTMYDLYANDFLIIFSDLHEEETILKTYSSIEINENIINVVL